MKTRIVFALVVGLLFPSSHFASEKMKGMEFIVDWSEVREFNPYTITPVGQTPDGKRVYEVECSSPYHQCDPQRIILNDDHLEVGHIDSKGNVKITASYGETRLFPLTEGRQYTVTGHLVRWGVVSHHFLVGDIAQDGTIPVLIGSTSRETGELVRSEIRYFNPERPGYWTRIVVLVLLDYP